MHSGCVFCLVQDDLELKEEFYNEPMLVGKYHYVLPGIGALRPGYSLLITKTHVRNFSILPEDWIDEYTIFFNTLKDFTTEVYGECNVFEHGSFGDGSGGCIDHAHIHFLGADVRLSDHLLNNFEHTVESDNPVLLKDNNRKYLFASDSSGGILAFPNKDLERQYLRRVVAQDLGKPEKWDYRVHFEIENVEKTVSAFKKWFSKMPAGK